MTTEAELKVLNAAPDPFEAAFDVFTKPREEPPVDPAPAVDKSAPSPVVEPVAEPLAVEKLVPAPKTDAEPAPVAKEAPSTEPEKPAANDQTEATLRRFTEAIEKVVKPAAPPPKEAPPQKEPEIYTAQEQAFLAGYEEEWSAVSTGEALKRRAEYRQVVQYVFDQILTQLRPMMATLGELSERAHLGDLEEVVEDYDDIRDKIVEWAAKQPTYLKVAYEHVIKHGEAEEVQDLINRWRVETDKVAAPVSAAAPRPTTTSANELTAGAKKAVARLAPVIGKRTGVQAGLDPNDFDNAFDTFANRLKSGE